MARIPAAPSSHNGQQPGSRAAKGRGRALAETVSGNAIESSSLERVELPPQPAPIAAPKLAEVPPMDRQQAIARAAYYRAEQRGFAPGFELEDWLEAEREVLAKEGVIEIG